MPKPTKNLLIRGDWSDESLPWLEEHLQAGVVMSLRRAGVAFEVGMEGVRLSKSQRAKAKLQGMEAGRCDLKILIPQGRTLHIELKRWSGRVSPEQTRWHDTLRALGFEAHVVKGKSPEHAVSQVGSILLQAWPDAPRLSCVRG